MTASQTKPTYRFLTAAKVHSLALRHGFEPDEITVRENAAHADNCHGKPCGLPGEAPRVSWGTDYRGYYDAAKLLDGLLYQVAQEGLTDALAHRKFCRDAYGE